MSGDERRLQQALDDRVVAYVYGELSASQADEFRLELEQNPELRAQVDDLRALQRNLDDVAYPEPPADVVADIMAYAASRNRVVRTEPAAEKRLTIGDVLRWLLTPQFGMAAAAVLVVAVGVYMGQNARRPTEPGSAAEVKERMRPTRVVKKEDAAAPAKADKGVASTAEKKAEPVPELPRRQAAGETAAPPQKRAEAEPQEAQPEEAQQVKGVDREEAAEDPAPSEERANAEAAETRVVTTETVDGPGGGSADPVSAGGKQTSNAEAAAEADSGLRAGDLKTTATGVAAMSDLEKEEAAKSLGKVAVRSLVDGLDRNVRRGASEPSRDKVEGSGEGQADGSLQRTTEKRERKSKVAKKSAERADGKDQAATGAFQFKQADNGGGLAEMERAASGDSEKKNDAEAPAVAFQHGGAPAPAPMPKAEEEVSLEEADDQEALAAEREANRQWLGNTYDQAVAGSVAEPAAEKEILPSAKASPKQAKTAVDEAWGVVPSDSLGPPSSLTVKTDDSTVSPVSVKQVNGNINFGDDSLVGLANEAPAQADKAPEPVAPTKPVMPAEPRAVYAEGTEGGQVPMDEDRVAADEKAPARPAESNLNDAPQELAEVQQAEKAEKTKVASEQTKQEEAKEAPKCDQYWVDLLKYKKKGQHAKALKLLQVFRSGLCQGTRSDNDLAMVEAELYIASGKRSQARKVLEKLQKVPAMEEKAMDMMEAIEEPGDAL